MRALQWVEVRFVGVGLPSANDAKDCAVLHRGVVGCSDAATVSDHPVTVPYCLGLGSIPCFDCLERCGRSVNFHGARVDIDANGLAHGETETMRTSVGAAIGVGSDCR